MDLIEEPLDIPGLPPIKVKVERTENAAQTAAEHQKIVWRKVRGAKRVHCNDCIDEMLAAGKQQFIWPAVAERTHLGLTRLLCYRHANEKRTEEGLDAIRAGSNGRDIK